MSYLYYSLGLSLL